MYFVTICFGHWRLFFIAGNNVMNYAQIYLRNICLLELQKMSVMYKNPHRKHWRSTH
uniref:Uncharacterized protein n=1 Tax=Lepeophtheirus salmonis TaxID=72036 RepID=A0A0K2U8I0_LEPSM